MFANFRNLFRRVFRAFRRCPRGGPQRARANCALGGPLIGTAAEDTPPPPPYARNDVWRAHVLLARAVRVPVAIKQHVRLPCAFRGLPTLKTPKKPNVSARPRKFALSACSESKNNKIGARRDYFSRPFRPVLFRRKSLSFHRTSR